MHRIVGHDQQAIWASAYTTHSALWGTLGRKPDPTGRRLDGRPIIDVPDIRRRVVEALSRDSPNSSSTS